MKELKKNEADAGNREEVSGRRRKEKKNEEGRRGAAHEKCLGI
jgi:hypothetical protein